MVNSICNDRHYRYVQTMLHSPIQKPAADGEFPVKRLDSSQLPDRVGIVSFLQGSFFKAAGLDRDAF